MRAFCVSDAAGLYLEQLLKINYYGKRLSNVVKKEEILE